jgi:hypothetical protein
MWRRGRGEEQEWKDMEGGGGQVNGEAGGEQETSERQPEEDTRSSEE